MICAKRLYLCASISANIEFRKRGHFYQRVRRKLEKPLFDIYIYCSQSAQINYWQSAMIEEISKYDRKII